MDFGRAALRYQSCRNPAVEMRMRLKKLAETRVRYGYRRLHDLAIFLGQPRNDASARDPTQRESQGPIIDGPVMVGIHLVS